MKAPKSSLFSKWLSAIAILIALFALLGQFILTQNRSIVQTEGLYLLGISIVSYIIINIFNAYYDKKHSIIEDNSKLSEYDSPSLNLKPQIKRFINYIAQHPYQIVTFIIINLLLFVELSLLAGNDRQKNLYLYVLFLWLITILMLLALTSFFSRKWFVFGLDKKDIWFLIALTTISLFLRLYKLGEIPEIVGGDEARIAELTITAHNGGYLNYFSTVFGHSTLYLHLRGLFLNVLGSNMVTFRLLEAVAGALTIPFLYLTGNSLFSNRKIALFSSLFLLGSHFHLHFSRISVAGNIMDGFITTITIWLFYSAIRHRNTTVFVLAGLVNGFHYYIYQGGRLTTLFLLAYMIVRAIISPKESLKNIWGYLAFLYAVFVTTTPMLHWMWTNSNEANARINQVSIFHNGWLANQALTTGKSEFIIFIGQFWKSILAIIYYLPTAFYDTKIPLLDVFTATFFILGCVTSLIYTVKSNYLLLNAWLWSAVLGTQAILLNPEVGFYRSIINLPTIMLMASVGLVSIINIITKPMQNPIYIRWVTSIALIACTLYINISYYFFDFGRSCYFTDAQTRYSYLYGTYASKYNPKLTKGYILAQPRATYGTHPNVNFLSNYLPMQNIDPSQAKNLNFIDTKFDAVFVFALERTEDMARIQDKYSNGDWTDIKDCGATVLRGYYVSLNKPNN